MSQYRVCISANVLKLIEAEDSEAARTKALQEIYDDAESFADAADVDDVQEGLLCLGCETFLPVEPNEIPTGVAPPAPAKHGRRKGSVIDQPNIETLTQELAKADEEIERLEVDLDGLEKRFGAYEKSTLARFFEDTQLLVNQRPRPDQHPICTYTLAWLFTKLGRATVESEF